MAKGASMQVGGVMASGWGAVVSVTSTDAGMGVVSLGVLPVTGGGSAASEAAIGPASMVLSS